MSLHLSPRSSPLTLLYEGYNGVSRLDDEQIRAGFNALYQAMNGMTFRDMDKIICPVCTLCRDHEKAGFAAGVKVGILLQSKLSENRTAAPSKTRMVLRLFGNFI